MIYRSKPQEVEAVQWNGTNDEDVWDFAGLKCGTDWVAGNVVILAGKDGAQGWVYLPVGHWIVRNPGDNSDLFPVHPDYFAEKYEAGG